MIGPYETSVVVPGPCDWCGRIAWTQRLCATCLSTRPARPLPSPERQLLARLSAEIAADRRARSNRMWANGRRITVSTRDLALALSVGRRAVTR